MSTAKRSGTYNPAEHGLAKYFLSMLDDKDRNVKYGEAIKKCIEEFKTKEQRKPRVLDIGIGTGMLSSLCLLHDAAHVTGVDVNSTMVGLARASLKALDPGGRVTKDDLDKALMQMGGWMTGPRQMRAIIEGWGNDVRIQSGGAASPESFGGGGAGNIPPPPSGFRPIP